MLARVLVAMGVFVPYFLAPIARPVWLTFLVALGAFGAGRLLVHLVVRPRAQALIGTVVLAAGGVTALALARLSAPPGDAYYLEAAAVAAAPDDHAGRRLRLHGHVQPGTLTMRPGATRFELEGGVRVVYDGTLPDGFRERTEVVVGGRLVDGVLQAETLLAKCPNSYAR